jgi:hypothetical protein
MTNPYSTLLKEYISDSRLSLSEIENEMRKRGLNKNKAYISNLQNGKIGPPPFEVTHALCNIIGGDPVRLAFTGVIMEISQQEFVPMIENTITTMLAVLLDINKKELSKVVSKSFTDAGFAMTIEDGLEVLEYDNIKSILDEVLRKILPNSKELIGEGISAATSEVEEILGFRTSSGNAKSLTLEEIGYLNECLMIYRKLKLKPEVT